MVPAPSPPAPYYVLDTDYENWASVFSCSEARPEGSSYILARRTDIDPEIVSIRLLIEVCFKLKISLV